MTDHKVYRVVVVDDSLLPRIAAKALLKASTNFRLVGEASAGNQAVDVVRTSRADVVLVDVDMPGMDGAATAAALREAFPDLKLVAWTVSESSDDLLRMIRAGCSGYVLKEVGPSELDHALTAAVRSEDPFPRKMIPGVLRKVAATTSATQTPPVKLTSRELQLLRSLAQGWSTKRISRETGLAVPTIETHLGNLYRKLGVGNRGEAVSAGLRANLLTLADV